MKEGVVFDGVVFSALFFADDLVLISRTRIRGMNRLLKAVDRFCRDMNMQLAVDKTVLLRAGSRDSTCKVYDEGPKLEASLIAKYLGVSFSVQRLKSNQGPRRENDSSARAFAHTIVRLTRSGLDRAVTAHKLWEVCAIPSILYATEAMIISSTTIKELDRIQNSIVRFILQLPRSAATLAGVLDGGLLPFGLRVMTKQVLFRHDLVNKKNDPIIRGVASVVFDDYDDSWTNKSIALLGITSLESVLKGAF